MLPHPILASKDDEEYIVRTVLGLPEILTEFFDCVSAVYIESRGPEYRSRANTLYYTIQRQLLVLCQVPSSAFELFHPYSLSKRTEATVENSGNHNNGNTTHSDNHTLSSSSTTPVNNELPKLLNRLSHLFLADVVGVGPNALSWRRPCLRIAEDCADHMREVQVHFSWHMRLRRQLSTHHSVASTVSTTLFAVLVTFSAVANIVLPSVLPSRAVGIPIGAVAAVLLLLISIVIFFQLRQTLRALYTLYNQLCTDALVGYQAPEEHLAYLQTTSESINKNRSDGFSTQHAVFFAPDAQTGSPAAGGTQVVKGKQTRRGFFTIPYNGDIGHIDGKQLDAQVPMIAYNKDFRITRWNAAAEQLTGFLEEGCVGKPITELVLPATGNISIADQLRRAKKGDIIKVKVRALATLAISLSTSVASIVNPNGDQVGSILICANTRDDLRQYRSYILDYQVAEAKSNVALLKEQLAPLLPENEILVVALEHFLSGFTASHLEGLARDMVTEWEWTNVEHFLGKALGTGTTAHDIVIDPVFPTVMCLSPLVSEALGKLVAMARGACSLQLNMLNVSGSIFSLSVAVQPGPKSRPWTTAKVYPVMQPYLYSTTGHMTLGETHAVLHFPCQVTSLLDCDDSAGEGEATADGPEASANGGMHLAQARTLINGTINVVTAIHNMVDQHNLSLILLKTMFVSLTSVREKSDLDQRIASGEVDVVICDSDWLSVIRDSVGSGEEGRLIVPLVSHETPLSQNFKYVLGLPIDGKEVLRTMTEVGKEISIKKEALLAKAERERILTLRQDSPWTKGKLLGRGSYGAVYEATSDLTGGKMAVKMFYFDANRQDSITQLLNEIKIMCSLNHPNIVHYFHCERKDNNVSLFMELCEASLTDLMTSRYKKPQHLTVVQIIRQVLAALVYLHSRGIAHRDVKPQNILLKGETIKLTDFGTARQGEAVKEVKGTFRYMAPEVYRGEPHSLSCDIWSIGCLVCELLACVPKFMEQAALLGEMTTAEPYLKQVPQNPCLVDFLSKCFRMRADERPTSHALLMHPSLSQSAISAEMASLPTVFDLGMTAKGSSKGSAFTLTSV